MLNVSNTFDLDTIKTMAERLATRVIVTEDTLCRLEQDVPVWAELALIRSSNETLKEVYETACLHGYGGLVDELLGTEYKTANARMTYNSPFSEDQSFDILMSCTFHVNKETGTYKIYVYNSDDLDIKTYDSFEEWENDPNNGMSDIGRAGLPLVFRDIPEHVAEMLAA